jgi:hypothetical protein
MEGCGLLGTDALLNGETRDRSISGGDGSYTISGGEHEDEDETGEGYESLAAAELYPPDFLVPFTRVWGEE